MRDRGLQIGIGRGCVAGSVRAPWDLGGEGRRWARWRLPDGATTRIHPFQDALRDFGIALRRPMRRRH
eukprot:4186778-Pyramimonas_sp.AAC.1